MGEPSEVEQFIAHWRDTGGSELANTQSFINGLYRLIGVESPHGSRTDDALNDYVFERRVFQDNGDGTVSFGRIDCYKRGAFIGAVQSILAAAHAPLAAQDIARSFKGKRAASVRPLLDALAGPGMARRLHDGRYAALGSRRRSPALFSARYSSRPKTAYRMQAWFKNG